ncbi:MAG: hypothetical protein IJV04_01300 [Lachnospiraceae bacterium]|nr:hypothetical protein [Lachnospiraceae bacterium]
MEYRYGMRLRGFSPGCQPKEGLLHREDDTTGRYHDIIVYDRKLTDQELSDYELDDLEYKSDAQRVKELLERNGYNVHMGVKYLIISHEGYSIGADLQPDPDEDNRTDCLFFSSNKNTDGFLTNFAEGCPEDEEEYILDAVEEAFLEERRYRDGRK